MEQHNLTYMTSDSVNISVFENSTLDPDEQFRSMDKVLFTNYKTMSIIIGILVVLCNLTVVVSSGLILKKGQQPKSTYILLGNVSLADTVVGMFLIYSALGNRTLALSGMCIFKTGMLVCPAIVSIFSVTLIAVDRYCYILHGLYYHRYFTTTKVRICIFLIWFGGLTLGFLPAAGIVNRYYPEDTLCSYMTLFPDYLILLNTFISITALVVIALLYSIILIHALRNVKNIKTSKINLNNKNDPNIRSNLTSITIHRGQATNPDSKNLGKSNKHDGIKFKRSASFSSNRDFHYHEWTNMNSKSKSISGLGSDQFSNNKKYNLENTKIRYSTTESDYSITSLDLSSSIGQNNSSVDMSTKHQMIKCCKGIKESIKIKKKEPSKLRAIIVVSLTSGSIIITWLPFFVTLILYVLCENKEMNSQCLQPKLLLGPSITLAFLNSLLNPIIYAWWHKGFKESLKFYYRRYIYNKISIKS